MVIREPVIFNPVFSLKIVFKKCEIIFAAILIASFFIPWVKVGGLLYYSGCVIPDALFTLAQSFEVSSGDKSGILIMAYASYLLYLIPLFSILIIVKSINNSALRGVSFAAGSIPFIALFYSIFEFGNIFNNLYAGFYLTIFASVLLLVSVYKKA
jgi:flagellar biosynthesis protein FlhB